jgi:anti-sigma regulatory factor (Ser/Thr protein kinase)
VCEHTPRAEISLPAGVGAPGLARRFLSDAVCVRHGRSVLDDALLLTSETITNAVVHGGPPIVLAVECTGAALEIRVRDGSSGLPRRTTPAAMSQHGRGLLLVETLSDDWGVDPAGPTGKEVWFRLRES